jgi:ATP-binding cassette subfamily B protein
MLTMNPLLTLLAMLTAPLLFYQTFTFARKIRPMWLALQQQMAILTTRLEQNLRGMRIVKGFAQEPAETERFEAENATWFQIAADSARLQSINGPLMGLITNIGSIFILWYGGRLVIEGGLTLGELVAFTAYMGQLAGPVRMMGRVIPAIVQAIACGERIFDILDAESEVKESPTPLHCRKCKATCALRTYLSPTLAATRCWKMSRWTCRRARSSPCSAPPAPARPPSSTSSPASTT